MKFPENPKPWDTYEATKREKYQYNGERWVPVDEQSDVNLAAFYKLELDRIHAGEQIKDVISTRTTHRTLCRHGVLVGRKRKKIDE